MRPRRDVGLKLTLSASEAAAVFRLAEKESRSVSSWLRVRILPDLAREMVTHCQSDDADSVGGKV